MSAVTMHHFSGLAAPFVRSKGTVSGGVFIDTSGKMRPLVIEFDEGHKYEVDAVLDVKRRACERVGGVGDRYTCRINGQETYLWLENGKWFVEAKL